MIKIRNYIFIGMIIVFPAICMAFNMEPEMKKYLDTAEVSEDGLPSGVVNLTDFPFRDYLTSNWRSILDNVETIAPSRRQQSVLMATATLLPSEDYLQFVSATIHKLEQGQIDKMSVRNGVIFPGPLRYGFLAVNYQNPIVQNICEKAKRLFPDDPDLQQYLNAILTGTAKSEAEKWASANNRKAPEMLEITSNADDSIPKKSPMEAVIGTPSSPKAYQPLSPMAETKSSSSLPIALTAIVVAVIMGIFIYFFSRKA